MKYFLYALVGFSFAIHSSPSFGEVVIGVLIDGPWERNDEIRLTFEQEILELTGREFDVSFPEEKQVTADWTAESLAQGLDQLLSDPEVDLVITAGVLGSNEAGHRTSFSKPVIAPFVINAALQGIPLVNGSSGIKNFTYVAFPSDVVHNIRIFQSVVSFDHMAYLYTPVVLQAIPELVQNLTRAVSELDLKIEFVPIQGDVAQAIAAIPDEVEAVFVLPLLGLNSSETDQAGNITLFGYELAALLSGAALTEIVCSYPGLGRLVLEAILAQDLYLVAGATLAGFVLLMTGNLIADALLAANDPRIRFHEESA